MTRPRSYNPRGRYTKSRPAFTAQTAITNPDAPATEKQLDFLTSLGHQRDCGMSVEDFDAVFAVWDEAGVLTKGFVSARIEEYKALPKREVKSAQPGYYSLDGEFYVVVKTKDGARTYAKRLTKSEGGKFSWEYAPGLGAKMASMVPMTEAQAGEWGHLHGHCMICLRPLTDPSSVQNGIGPVCASKLRRI